jgi:hypothetical protein
MQQYLPKQEFQRTHLLVQGPSSSNSDMLKAAIVVQQIIIEPSETCQKETK